MSASSKKKLRKEQRVAALTQKQQAAAKEAKKLKTYTITFWVILALCVSLVAGIALRGPVVGIASRMTTALVVGDHEISAVELNYFYVDAINEYVNSYGSYLQYTGLSTSTPLSSQKQGNEGSTWADYFVKSAIDSAKNTYALYDAAIAAGHKLSEEEKTSMQSLYDNMDVYAKAYGYNNAKAYLKSIYGDGATTKSYKAYYEVVVMASSYYAAYAEDLKDSYTSVILRDFEGDKAYEYNSYSYYTYYLALDKCKFGGTKGSDGKVTYSAEELKAAEEYIEKVAELLSDPEINTVEKLNAKIAEIEAQLALDKAAAENKTEDTTTPEEGETETTPEEGETESTPEGGETETAPEEGETAPEGEAEAQTADDEEVTEEQPEEGETEEQPEEGETEEKPEDSETEEKPEDSETEEKPEDSKTDKDDDKYTKATEVTDKLYSGVSSLMQEWLRDTARKEGDITSLKYTSTSKDSEGKETETLNGIYIVLFKSVNDNQYALANVRHILVKYEGGTTNTTTGQTTYSQAEKDAAKKQAEKIYDEWLKGAMTEDSFAELAKKYTDDSNGDEGGLYEDVYPGQMVTTFNDWCFDEIRKAGDHGVVQTDYGWHVMFYSGDSETTYRDYMVTNDKLEADMEAWQDGLVNAISLTEKTTKFINKDYIISSTTSY